jgi:hypothetical protein
MTAGLPMSPRINDVGGCFDDLPEGTVGTVVVNAPSVVRAQFLQHAEADEPTEFLSHLSLQDHLAGWFGLVETCLVMPGYPEGERQPARSSEEFLAYVFRIQRRVHVYELITTI